MPNRNGCTHYWIIEEARGPTSRGVCRKCGKVMMHPNQTELSWGGAEEKRSVPVSPGAVSAEGNQGEGVQEL